MIHYSTFLAANFIRALIGKSLLDSYDVTPEDLANLKVVSAYAIDGGSHFSFKFKDQLYTMDVKAIMPKVLIVHPKIKEIDNPLMCEDLLKQGGI